MKKKLTQKFSQKESLLWLNRLFAKTSHQEIFNISIYIQGLIKVKRECQSWMLF